MLNKMVLSWTWIVLLAVTCACVLGSISFIVTRIIHQPSKTPKVAPVIQNHYAPIVVHSSGGFLYVIDRVTPRVYHTGNAVTIQYKGDWDTKLLKAYTYQVDTRPAQKIITTTDSVVQWTLPFIYSNHVTFSVSIPRTNTQQNEQDLMITTAVLQVLPSWSVTGPTGTVIVGRPVVFSIDADMLLIGSCNVLLEIQSADATWTDTKSDLNVIRHTLTWTPTETSSAVHLRTTTIGLVKAGYPAEIINDYPSVLTATMPTPGTTPGQPSSAITITSIQDGRTKAELANQPTNMALFGDSLLIKWTTSLSTSSTWELQYAATGSTTGYTTLASGINSASMQWATQMPSIDLQPKAVQFQLTDMKGVVSNPVEVQLQPTTWSITTTPTLMGNYYISIPLTIVGEPGNDYYNSASWNFQFFDPKGNTIFVHLDKIRLMNTVTGDYVLACRNMATWNSFNHNSTASVEVTLDLTFTPDKTTHSTTFTVVYPSGTSGTTPFSWGGTTLTAQPTGTTHQYQLTLKPAVVDTTVALSLFYQLAYRHNDNLRFVAFDDGAVTSDGINTFITIPSYIFSDQCYFEVFTMLNQVADAETNPMTEKFTSTPDLRVTPNSGNHASEAGGIFVIPLSDSSDLNNEFFIQYPLQQSNVEVSFHGTRVIPFVLYPNFSVVDNKINVYALDQMFDVECTAQITLKFLNNSPQFLAVTTYPKVTYRVYSVDLGGVPSPQATLVNMSASLKATDQFFNPTKILYGDSLGIHFTPLSSESQNRYFLYQYKYPSNDNVTDSNVDDYKTGIITNGGTPPYKRLTAFNYPDENSFIVSPTESNGATTVNVDDNVTDFFSFFLQNVMSGNIYSFPGSTIVTNDNVTRVPYKFQYTYGWQVDMHVITSMNDVPKIYQPVSCNKWACCVFNVSHPNTRSVSNLKNSCTTTVKDNTVTVSIPDVSTKIYLVKCLGETFPIDPYLGFGSNVSSSPTGLLMQTLQATDVLTITSKTLPGTPIVYYTASVVYSVMATAKYTCNTITAPSTSTPATTGFFTIPASGPQYTHGTYSDGTCSCHADGPKTFVLLGCATTKYTGENCVLSVDTTLDTTNCLPANSTPCPSGNYHDVDGTLVCDNDLIWG